ncbi:hydrolase [Pontibacter qinzhouensis]|uniref:Hydrolase n=1 Tax=Pontibacter qinzhouensis TaxID=2603253 RepID=A0A5C8KB15_9BACT|nr:hydrolase [Pontibacter qinzhouensis]TXK49248.1 hydrolase [Pontibacter qinzhouensis]
MIPTITGNLRKHFITVPDEINRCSGIKVFGQLLKSFVFSTDVAIIRNINADAVIALYPFTPQPIIAHALMLAADKPVFCGVGGGVTSGKRSVEIALDAEFQGALGVIVNKPTPNELIRKLKDKLEIPVVVTVVSMNDDIAGRLAAGTDIFNVSGAEKTAAIVRQIKAIDPGCAVIATGGKTAETIQEVIAAGANAVSYTPPSSAELVRNIMNEYRKEC